MKNIGDVINTDDRRYRIIDIIGRGASCIAYLAERSENSFVSKCILKEYAPQNTYDFEHGKKSFFHGRRPSAIFLKRTGLHILTFPAITGLPLTNFRKYLLPNLCVFAELLQTR